MSVPRTRQLPRYLSSLRFRATRAALSASFSWWPLLLPAVLLLPAARDFPYPNPGALFSDLAISHYPNALILRQSFLSGRWLPLWSPSIFSGYPFFANPLSGLWYPPGWLALFLPLPLGFNLLITAHLIWGGIGMYRLLRGEGRSYPAALLGALAFEMLPKLFAHYGAGHLTLLYAVSWTPWMLLSVESYRLKVEGCSGDHFLGYQPARAINIKSAVVLTLVFLADPRWAFYAGLFWWFYTFVHRQVGFLDQEHFANLQPSTFNRIRPSTFNRIYQNLHLLRNLSLQTALAFLLAAPLALPLLEFTRLSTRSALSSLDVFSFSLPPSRLLGLIFPAFGGYHEWTLYPGVLVFALAVLALFKTRGKIRGNNTVKFWAFTAVISVLFSLGSNLPLLTALGRLPGLDLLRVPSRALFITGISLAALAAAAVDRLMQDIEPDLRLKAGRILTGLTGFALAFAVGIWVITRNFSLNFFWGAGVLLVGSVWIGLRLAEKIPPKTWFAGMLALCCLDLAAVDYSLFNPRPAQTVLAEGQAAIEFLQAQPGLFRVYSPSYSLPQQTAVLAGIELASGVDPLQLTAYSAFMEKASGVPAQGYSVTLPSMTDSGPPNANREARPDPYLLGLLNVRYVAAEYDLPVQGLVLRRQFGETRVYENLQARPRAWIQPADAPLGDQYQLVGTLSWSPDRIVMDVPGPGGQTSRWLVLSELAYPGWHAWVDGRPVEVESAGGLLRAVRLQPGPHQVIFAFHPLSLYLALGLCMAGWILIAAIILWNWRHDENRIVTIRKHSESC